MSLVSSGKLQSNTGRYSAFRLSAAHRFRAPVNLAAIVGSKYKAEFKQLRAAGSSC